MDARSASTSRWLSYLLRHGAPDHGIWLWPGGWADLDQVAAEGGNKRSTARILSVASADREGRFQVLFDGVWWIRATPPEERCLQKWIATHGWDDDPALVPEPQWWVGAW